MTNHVLPPPSNPLIITTDDGRRVAVGQYGDPDGPAVLLLPAAPGSRDLDPDPAATVAAGVRLLVPDRPGYGGSDALAPGVVPNWRRVAADHARLVEVLDVGAVHVIGWSNGGLGALALAAARPDLVDRVTVLGTPAPHDEVPWIPDEFAGALAALRSDPAAAVDVLEGQLAALAADVDAAVSGLGAGPDDRALLGRRDVRRRLAAMVATAFDAGPRGLASDIVATNVVTERVDPRAVTMPVRLVYGSSDELVPVSHGRWWADALPHATLDTPRAGHLAVLSWWGMILAPSP